MSEDMRFSRLLAPLVTIVMLLVFARPALASCAPPLTVVENAQRADAVVHGRITGIGGRALQVDVLRTLKGSAPPTVSLFVGPGRGSVITSVDYAAQVGTEHVLFIMKVADGYETNACVGSHAGGPSAEEIAFFGTASTTAPSAAAPAATAEPRALGDRAPGFEVGAIALSAAAALTVAASGFLIIKRLRHI